MAADSEKNKINNKRDKEFLKFAREYQEKIGNIVETQGNTEFKTISQIETRLNLLLPENYLCFKECIVCIENPYGAWGETFDMETGEEDDANKIAVKKVLKRKEKKLLQELKMVRKKQKSILSKWKKADKPSVKASIENEYKKQERKERKIAETLYDRRRNEYPIFKKFTTTERNLYDILLKGIQSEKDNSDHINVRAIKNKGWWIVDEEKRRKIYKLFSKAVKENRQKWKLSDSDLNMVHRKMFCPKYNKTILEKDKLLKMETPNSWIEIIRRNSKAEVENEQEKKKEEEKEFIKNLKKLEKTLKKLGVTQQAVDNFQTEGYGFNQDEFAKWLEGMYKEEKR